MQELPAGYCPSILTVGRMRNDSGKLQQWKVVPQTSYRLIIVEDGVLEVMPQGWSIKRGEALLVPPHPEIEYRWLPACVLQTVLFDVVFVPCRGPLSGRIHIDPKAFQPTPEAIFGVKLEGKLSPRLAGLACQTLLMIRSRYCFSVVEHLRADARLSLFLAEVLMEYLPNAADESYDSLIERAEEYVRQNVRHSLGVAEMARAVGLSREYFTRLYIDCRRRSPGAYIKAERIQLAKALLCESNKSLEKIAHIMGYSELKKFRRYFIRNMNVSPECYREQNRSNNQ